METAKGTEVENKDAPSNSANEKEVDESTAMSKSDDNGTNEEASVDTNGINATIDENIVKESSEEKLTPEDNVEDVELNETIDLSKEPPLEDETRNKMFEEGLKHDKDGKKLEALKCYLKCLVGLKENTKFALLPQCLRNIGDIYYGRDEYEKAISFIQAEKLYYESVLIDDTELQKHIDEVTAEGATNQEDTNVDALRATEYEQLSKLCMDEKQPQLALEYAGKCTKLRQKVYGDDHPIVKQTLDYFATVYAEVGKVQYTESMGKYDTASVPDITADNTLTEDNDTTTTEPTSILRRRKISEGIEREKRVRFDESQVPSDETMDREERIARAVLLFLFFILLFVLIILGIYIFCSLQPSDRCHNIRVVIHDTVIQLKYLYYQLWSKTDNKSA